MSIPLALYIHIPWCVQTCPYCDFNSHKQKGVIPEHEYIAHLLADLDQDIALITHKGNIRPISSIFIGGGTPSLLSVEAMHKLLNGIQKRLPILENAEISMEANPGTAEAAKFLGFTQAGINRMSIGVQSFDEKHLSALGRVHGAQHSHNALTYARELPLTSFNADIMHGLPEQKLQNALDDLHKAIAHNPPHLSWYQLTIEPNTRFHSQPPVLPNDDLLWEIQQQGQALLASKGYEQYEVSAYGQPGHRCEQNLHYWRFSDYLGIGCGAHGKITNLSDHSITRTEKVKHPKGYMDISKPYLYKDIKVQDEELAFEFFMNRFRLLEACPKEAYLRLTGNELNKHELQILNKLSHKGLLDETSSDWQVTELGRRYLNSLLEEFV